MRRIVTCTVLLVLVAAVAGCGGAGHQAQPPFMSYVALGDSYTAAPLVPKTDAADGCFRSDHNYPSLVAQALGVPKFVDRSCGAATTADMTGVQRPGVPPQLDALHDDTALVTLSIGGNDDRVFGSLLGQCIALAQDDPTGKPCTDKAAQDPGKLKGVLASTQAAIVDVIGEIRRRSPHAKLLVVGYPLIFPRQGTCPALTFAPGDVAYAVRVNRGLDDVLRRAAATTHSTFVDVWKASLGHDICSSSPWVNGARTAFDAAAAYHPFEVEQRAVSQLVLHALGQ